MDDQLKINCISEFCEEIHGWVSSIEVFEGVCLQTNTPSFIREAFFNVLKLKIKNLIGNSAENFNRLFLILSDSEKKEAYRELPENWVLKNIASIEDFSIVGIHLDEDALKTLLDSDSISKKTALEFIMLLCEKKELKSTPALVSLVLSHQKTKTMIERTFRSGTITGDFIDLTHKNKACLSIVLASDYYKTEDGIRALNAALLRYRSDDETVQAIKDTLQKNQKQKKYSSHRAVWGTICNQSM